MEYEVEAERVIAFRVEIAKILGSNDAALMFQQIAHWSQYTRNKDGWIYKSASEMDQETNVSERKQRKARQILIDMGWIEAEKLMANGSPTWHYRMLVNVNTKVLASASTSSTGILPGATGKNAGSITKKTHKKLLYVDFAETLEDEVHKLYKGWLIEMVIGQRKYLALDTDSRVLALTAAATRNRLTEKRYSKARARLESIGYEVCAKAIKNCGASDFHKGQNDRGWKATFEWLFNSDERTEEFANRRKAV